jgi:hypothetical protein
MSAVTVSTITDEQIAALLEIARTTRDYELFTTCKIALNLTDPPNSYSPEFRQRQRQLCVAAFNKVYEGWIAFCAAVEEADGVSS